MVIDYSTTQDSHTYSAHEKESYFEVMSLTSAGTRVAVLVTKMRRPVVHSIVVERTGGCDSLGWVLDVHDYNAFWNQLHDHEKVIVRRWIERCENITEYEGSVLLKELKREALATKIRQRWFRTALAASESQGA